jgi:hypothetical protein
VVLEVEPRMEDLEVEVAVAWYGLLQRGLPCKYKAKFLFQEEKRVRCYNLSLNQEALVLKVILLLK